MKGIGFGTIKDFGRKNAPFLGSTGAALILYSAPSKILLLLEAAIFCAVVLSAWLERDRAENPVPSRGAGLAAAAFALAGLLRFWGMNGSVSKLLAAMVLAVLSFYAFWRLCGRMDGLLCRILGTEATKGDFAGLKQNWLFPLSALAFFVLASGGEWSVNLLCGWTAAFGLAAMTACRMPPMTCQVRETSLGTGIYSAAAAAGTCWAQAGSWEDPAIALALAVCAMPFALCCMGAMVQKLKNLMGELVLDLPKKELAAYLLLAVAALAFVTAVYLKTDAFYGTAHPYDIVYTADSPTLVKENAYLLVRHEQNDLRQPLFALFAAPVVGCTWLVSRLLSAGTAVHGLLIQGPQVLLLLLSHLLLARACGFAGMKRVGFVGVLSVSYPSVLFLLTMEQYVIAYFYVCLLLYAFGRKQGDPVAYWGASGTLLTSAVLLPVLSRRHPVREFRAWFRDMAEGGIGLIAAILAFSRAEILLDAVTSFLDLNRFSGAELSFSEKLYQYLAFVPSCLVAPAAEVVPNMWGVTSWQLTVPQGIALGGVVILLLAGISAVLNRKRELTCLAAYWVLFSLGILLVFGWGTQENGLILYSLYFGWAFLLLLQQLGEYLLVRVLKKEALVGPVTLAAAALLAAVNAPAIGELIRFAADHYPR